MSKKGDFIIRNLVIAGPLAKLLREYLEQKWPDSNQGMPASVLRQALREKLEREMKDANREKASL